MLSTCCPACPSSWLMSICQLRRQNDLLPYGDNRSLIALHWSLCKWEAQRGGQGESSDDDDIVTAVTFNEIENRTCNRNVQRFAYACNASESHGWVRGSERGARSGQVICLFFEESPPQMEGQAGRQGAGGIATQPWPKRLPRLDNWQLDRKAEAADKEASVCVCVCSVYLCVCGIYCI